MKGENTLTMNQRQKISKDRECATHVYGTIWSVVSDEDSKLRCSVAKLSDMPDSTSVRFSHFIITARCLLSHSEVLS